MTRRLLFVDLRFGLSVAEADELLFQHAEQDPRRVLFVQWTRSDGRSPHPERTTRHSKNEG